MLRKIYLMVAFALITTFAFAQTGTLKGVITDVMSGEPIPFANVVAERNGNQIGGTTTDFDGNFIIKPLDPGDYTIKATFVESDQTRNITMQFERKTPEDRTNPSDQALSEWF